MMQPTMTTGILCSIPILTLNSLEGLKRLLPLLVGHFDDVFIVDGNSTDGTREYAASLGVRIENQFDDGGSDRKIGDFAAMRRRSWAMCHYPWVLWLDSDEVPAPEFLDRVEEIVRQNASGTAHRFIRAPQLPDGRVVRHAFYFPERIIRLFNRNDGLDLADRPVHEKFLVPAGVRIEDHPERILAPWPAPAEFMKRQYHYLTLDEKQTRSTWEFLIRWIIAYNLRSLAGQFLRAVAASLRGALRGETAMPWLYNFVFFRYRILRITRGTRAWIERRSSASEYCNPAADLSGAHRGEILILTQKLNEDDFDLWFFVHWVNAFTKYFKKVHVICLEERRHPNLSPDVHVMSMGKERGLGKIGRMANLYRHLWRVLPNVDGVFIHMNQVYAILGWPLYIFFRKKRAIWYNHRTIPWDLKLAVRLVNNVFTAADQTFPYPTRKKIFTGHGIDTRFYRPLARPHDVSAEGRFKLLSLGRITPTKNQLLMCRAMKVLRDRGRRDIVLRIYSRPMLPSDVRYFDELKAFVAANGLEDTVIFSGRAENRDMPRVYNEHDLFLNFALTTGIDKAVLEAMACGRNVLTSNATFREMLPERHFIEDPTPESVATAIESFVPDRTPNLALRDIVIKDHDLDRLMCMFHGYYMGSVHG
jgi:glycosyltransferase involved in cell wall biosynthesis